MALFTALVAVVVMLFWRDFMAIAVSNIYLNGIIIGTALFGIGACFVDIFRLLPEYKWLRRLARGERENALPPRLLRPVAIILQNHNAQLSTHTLQGFLDMILLRFDEQRESVRYVTNTLIFLGLLGTFWGLILTVGGFAELIGNLNFEDESVLTAMQAGLSQPLFGMTTAFTSSLLGLAGSLVVGFLGLQVQLAQNAIFRELEETLADRTRVVDADNAAQLNAATQNLGRAMRRLDKTISQLT
ncbi:MAG: hypothetical protein K2L95_03760 [Alphaproteobacteria bacterium]|nr:hypothetical protein [Alphaproteobacteria bacterium]